MYIHSRRSHRPYGSNHRKNIIGYSNGKVVRIRGRILDWPLCELPRSEVPRRQTRVGGQREFASKSGLNAGFREIKVGSLIIHLGSLGIYAKVKSLRISLKHGSSDANLSLRPMGACLSIYLSIYLSSVLFIYLSMYLCIYVSIYICLKITINMYTYIYIFTKYSNVFIRGRGLPQCRVPPRQTRVWGPWAHIHIYPYILLKIYVQMYKYWRYGFTSK